MPLSLNGWSYGRIEIGVPSDRDYVVIDLPMTNDGNGLEERTDYKEIADEEINFDFTNPDIIDEQTHLGYKINWIFHYETFISGADLYNIFAPIINARKEGLALYLTPRIDEPLRKFRVNLVDESLTLMIRHGGAQAKLHKGVLFTFRTKYLEQDLKWFLQPDPNTTFGVTFNHFVKAA